MAAPTDLPPRMLALAARSLTSMRHDRDPPSHAEAASSVRLDIWLWAARFFRTRSLAKQAVETGKVEVAGQRAKPSRVVRVGDGLRILRGDEAFAVTVAGVSDDRGPASSAQRLYVESDASREARLARSAEQRAQRAGYRAPETRPDKRARRLIRALGDLDAS